MANEVKAKFGTVVTPTITLTSLANAAGRISSQIDNTTLRATRGFLALLSKTGAVAPTANTILKIYLIRNSNDATVNIQGGRLGASALGTADAAVTTEPVNDECIGQIQVPATTGLIIAGVFPVTDPGPIFSFVVWNAIGQAISSTAGDHVMQWRPDTDEIQ